MTTYYAVMATTSRRTGRRPGPESTKGEILNVARRLFSERGFRGTTIRGIAEQAGVDPALIHRHFGSKDALFAAAVALPEDGEAAVLDALRSDAAQLGERLSRAYLQLWEDPATRDQMSIGTRTALADAEQMKRFQNSVRMVLRQLEPSMLPGAPEPARFTAAMTQLFGVASGRHITQLAPLQGLTFEDLIAIVGPAIQTTLFPGSAS